MARSVSLKEAKPRAGRFCATRERSPNEVLEKIQSWGISEEDASNIVGELIGAGYINEQRFANAYCHDKFTFQSWGKQKIKASIYPHKLPGEVVQKALDRINPDEYEQRLLELAQRKWDSVRDSEPLKKKQKAVNYLANKGFELDLIWKTVGLIEEKSL